MASMIVRVTYTMIQGELGHGGDQPWIVSPKPWESPVGLMEEDGPFMRGGVDIFVFGHACAPGGRPVQELPLTVRVGQFVRRAIAVGPRVWAPNASGTLIPSAPAPFTQIPLTPAHAYGGTAEHDGLGVPYADNPHGKGYYLTAAQAQGRELPNLEEPEARVQRWNDVAPVCGFGFCPRANSQRLRNGTVLDQAYKLLDFRPQLFNQAFVPMIAPRVQPGDVISLEGFAHHGSITLAVPPPPAWVRLVFGNRIEDRWPSIDQLGIEVDASRLFVTYRFPYRYTVRAREQRECHLIPLEARG